MKNEKVFNQKLQKHRHRKRSKYWSPRAWRIICYYRGNNAGKSNVLKAIESLGNSYLDKEDYPNYTFYDFSPNEESSLTPTIGYYTDDKDVEIAFDADTGESYPVFGFRPASGLFY